MRKAILSIAAFLVLALVTTGCGTDSSSDSTAERFSIPTGKHKVRYEEKMKVGPMGLVEPEPKPIIPDSAPPKFLSVADLLDGIGHIYGETEELTIGYVAYDYETGEKFASSWDEGKPFTFKLGDGEVIDGWEEGLQGLEGGDRRELVVPPDEAEGPFPKGIPDGHTTVFVVEPLPVEGKKTGKKKAAAKPAEKPSNAGASAPVGTKPKVKVPSGPPPKDLEITDLKEGSGPAAKAGDEVTVQYVGVNYKTGKQFDASWDRGEPFTFKLGEGLVIQGWEKGLEGMKPGGRRELVIPPQLGYGSQSSGPIPANETLVFVVDLEAIK